MVHPSEVGGNGDTSLLLKIRDTGMQGQECLRPAEILEIDLASFLLSGGPMGLSNQIVTASRPDGLNVLYSVEKRKFTNGRSITPEFVSMSDVWHVVSHQ